MKLYISFILVLLTMVELTTAVYFKQHSPHGQPNLKNPKVNIVEFVEKLRQKTANRQEQNQLPGQQDVYPQQNGTLMTQADWLRKMNKLGGKPNGIPGQFIGMQHSQNVNEEQEDRYLEQQNVRPRPQNRPRVYQQNLRPQPNSSFWEFSSRSKQKGGTRRPMSAQGRNRGPPNKMAAHGRANVVC